MADKIANWRAQECIADFIEHFDELGFSQEHLDALEAADDALEAMSKAEKHGLAKVVRCKDCHWWWEKHRVCLGPYEGQSSANGEMGYCDSGRKREGKNG